MDKMTLQLSTDREVV